MEPIQDVDSLSHFKENSREIIARLKASGQPLTLTVDGEAELVVLARESYSRMLALVDRAEAIEGIHRGLAAMERGEGRPAREVFEDIRKRHRLDLCQPGDLGQPGGCRSSGGVQGGHSAGPTNSPR